MISAWLAVVLLAAPDSLQVSRRPVRTEAGTVLALYRYVPPGGGGAAPPVLLIADVGWSHSLFDSGTGGFARSLAKSGRTVYVAELRGQGAAEGARSLRGVVTVDLPAIARVISAERPGPVDLVAHGYLGALAVAAAGRELNVRKLVAVNVPVDPDQPTELLHGFLQDGGRLSSLAGSPQGFETFAGLFALRTQASHFDLVQPLVHARDLGQGVSEELLAWLAAGDFPLDDGSTVRARIRSAPSVPTLVVLALGDGFAHPEWCIGIRDGREHVSMRTYTRLLEGDDFSHVSIWVGERAERLVFPDLVEFLR